MDKSNMKNLVKQGYNLAADNYAAGRDMFKNAKYLEIFDQMIKPNSVILDIGCGNGNPIDKFLSDRGHSIIGIDISEKQIELAKKNFPNQTFELRDMSEVQLGEFKVDAVVSFYAIFHIPKEEHAELFKKINSFLPIGGLMLVTLGSDNWEGSEENFFGAKMYWSQNTPEDNIKFINNAGFEIVLNEMDTSGNEKHNVIIAKKIR